MVYRVRDSQSNILDALIDIEDGAITLHSRGGTKGKDATNVDYFPTLRCILQRVYDSGRFLEGAWVDSRATAALSLAQRSIWSLEDSTASPKQLARRLTSNMQGVGRRAASKPGGGSPTKRIRLQVSGNPVAVELVQVLGAILVEDKRVRLSANELRRVTAENIWNAIQKLLGGGQHKFGPSTDYDLLLDSGKRLPPKAVFGIAATEALGFEVLPNHFSAGSTSFSILKEAGYRIVRKGTVVTKRSVSSPPSINDPEWSEGSPRVRRHLQRERHPGLRDAKRAEFRRIHGKLFCEQCGLNPTETYGSEVGDSCIEIHHRIQVKDMPAGHKTKLSDVACLCANCHRVEHRRLRDKIRAEILLSSSTALGSARLK
jgi:hypothetical protein